jgi:hypothetical protein
LLAGPKAACASIPSGGIDRATAFVALLAVFAFDSNNRIQRRRVAERVSSTPDRISIYFPVYVAFDGDKDKWAYAFMKGWKTNERVDFDFEDAHDLDAMTGRAQSEQYVKSMLKERMKASCVYRKPYPS